MSGMEHGAECNMECNDCVDCNDCHGLGKVESSEMAVSQLSPTEIQQLGTLISQSEATAAKKVAICEYKNKGKPCKLTATHDKWCKFHANKLGKTSTMTDILSKIPNPETIDMKKTEQLIKSLTGDGKLLERIPASALNKIASSITKERVEGSLHSAASDLASGECGVKKQVKKVKKILEKVETK